MKNFRINGDFGQKEFDSIEGARAVLIFAFEKHFEINKKRYFIQCKTFIGENSHRSVSVDPFDAEATIPPADAYAAFDHVGGSFILFDDFQSAKNMALAAYQQRYNEMRDCFTVEYKDVDPETSTPVWRFFESLTTLGL
jgi:hypothetical protein